MKRVEIWETSDGKRFDSEEAAASYEAAIAQRDALHKLFDDYSIDDAVDFIMNHFPEIKAIMEPAPRWGDVGDAIGLALHKLDHPSQSAISMGSDLDRAVARLRAVMAVLEGFGFKFTGAAESPMPVKDDPRPANCRFRLMDEGKEYPRSRCNGCGRSITTGLGRRCHLEEQAAT